MDGLVHDLVLGLADALQGLLDFDLVGLVAPDPEKRVVIREILIALPRPTFSLARIAVWIAASPSTLQANVPRREGIATTAANLGTSLSFASPLLLLQFLTDLLGLPFLHVLLHVPVASSKPSGGLTISPTSFQGMKTLKSRRTS